MYIYADVILLINILMNSLTLILTAWVSASGINVMRIVLAAILGSVYSLGEVFPDLSIFYIFPVKLLISVFMVLVAFGRMRSRRFFAVFGSFYLVAFVLGGAVTGWLLMMQAQGAISNFSWKISWEELAIGSLIGLAMILVVAVRLIKNAGQRRLIYDVAVRFAGKEICTQALLDTGNSLYSNLGRIPVILIECKAVYPIFDIQTVSFLKETPAERWVLELTKLADCKLLERIQIVPVRGIGGAKMLLGFRPDCLQVSSHGLLQVSTSDVVIAFYPGEFSSDGSYRALLHPAIVDGTNKKQGESVCA